VRARNLKTADVIAILQQRRRIQQKPTASRPSAESSASIVLPTGQAAGTFPAQETTRTSTSLPVQETATVVEHERRASKPSPALALVVLERKLHKDQTQLQKALGWIMSEVPAMNSEEKALVRTYVQQWCQLFQQASEEI